MCRPGEVGKSKPTDSAGRHTTRRGPPAALTAASPGGHPAACRAAHQTCLLVRVETCFGDPATLLRGHVHVRGRQQEHLGRDLVE